MHGVTLAPYLEPNAFVDSDHPAILAFAREHAAGLPPREAAVALYDVIRDGWRYTPWNVTLTPDGFRASLVVMRTPRQGHCIDKALLLAASCRALGIPARLHFANVRNHIGTAKLEEQLGTDLLVFHGYTEIWLDGRWVAATPAFNKALCERLGVPPLAFDGVNDSVFQEHDRGGFMEYVDDHGTHAGIPFDDMIAAWKQHYPAVAEGSWPSPTA